MEKSRVQGADMPTALISVYDKVGLIPLVEGLLAAP